MDVLKVFIVKSPAISQFLGYLNSFKFEWVISRREIAADLHIHDAILGRRCYTYMMLVLGRRGTHRAVGPGPEREARERRRPCAGLPQAGCGGAGAGAREVHGRGGEVGNPPRS